MAISVFELFSIGIGPSSSHTVGPMRAAGMFLDLLKEKSLFETVDSITVELYGSLAATGKGHGTDKAVVAGLLGCSPETVDPDTVNTQLEELKKTQSLHLGAGKIIPFNLETQIQFVKKAIGSYSNTMKFFAEDKDEKTLLEKTYCSIGGGFVVEESVNGETQIVKDSTALPFEFTTGDRLLELTKEHSRPISSLVLENEKVWRSEKEVKQKLLTIWQAMQQCVEKGCSQEGILPGGLKVKRRAAELYKKLQSETVDPFGNLQTLEWVNMWALAVNEENAAGGRVVTAPTNGAAGIIPAVMHFYDHFCEGANEEGIIKFLLTAAAIGFLFKENASISGADVGCQGEVGSACSMAAGALCEVLGGTPQQVENAAEIGMEHNLGLTCDPIRGLVQVPCIERNAMASVKAINAAKLALRGDGTHLVSLDKVIKTMRDTGRDMKTKYKETSRGGLAVNVIEC